MYNFTSNDLLLLLSNELPQDKAQVLTTVLSTDAQLLKTYNQLQAETQELAELEIAPSAGCLNRLLNAVSGKGELV